MHRLGGYHSMPLIRTYANLPVGRFAAGFLLHRDWFRLELAPDGFADDFELANDSGAAHPVVSEALEFEALDAGLNSMS